LFVTVVEKINEYRDRYIPSDVMKVGSRLTDARAERYEWIKRVNDGSGRCEETKGKEGGEARS